ncbi:redoxin domain-containing protein [Candidatus Bathyarchaeota archaeon]|nr:redoxin domain-containing protein [Candidatus Bathyarchaeota archaeon]
MVEVGVIAPGFTLIGTDMKPKKLTDWKGKNIVLAFFPGAFTGICKKEMCILRDDLAKLEGVNAQIIGISVNDPFSQKAFSEENLLTFPLLCDYNREVIKLYDVVQLDFAGLKGYVTAKRSIFILDKDMKIRYKWVSNDARIEPNYEEVKKELTILV